jgi:NADH-quinone oxidoreductase subunit L
MEKYLYIALFAPLAGAIFSAFFGNTPKRLLTGIVNSSLLGVAMVASIVLFGYVFSTGNTVHVKMLDWIMAGSISIPFGFIVDQVSVTMMVVVSVVSTMVHIHSIGYMDHDKGFNRYFSYLSAFVFSMMILVMSDNFLGLFIGWEGVGLCSWLLIGFWYHKHSASWAANEAFIMNRVADLGMLVGIFLIYWNLGTLQYDEVFSSIKTLDISTITWIGIFLFIGAMGKSAQFPFHPWLADAMEGPTPVSALIHAATMVTAGVYLVIRANEIYVLIPDVGFFIASLGAFVAMFAASMALINNDMKRIIAYSTLSQLGYMFVAAGIGAYWVALFHLATHAFFKSVLFLGAGNVMHAMDDELNIKKMGGLHLQMKSTSIIMTIASLALAGIFPFAGFYSKDLILEAAFNEHAYIIWTVLWITAGLTAFYSFRLVMLVFHGESNYKKFGFHPHEAQKFVIYAMIPLAILAMIAGWFEHSFVEFVTVLLPSWEASEHTHHVASILIGVTSAIAIFGIAVAVYKYSRGGFSKDWENTFFYNVLKNQYFIPKFYEIAVIKPYYMLSKTAWKNIDLKIVDATVDLIGKIFLALGRFGSSGFQSGNLSNNLRWMNFGLILLIVLMIIFKMLG